MFHIEPHIYSVSDLDFLLSKIKEDDFLLRNDGWLYYNHPVSFDIETSSFYEENEKRAIMYAFTFNINGFTIIGRTREEFLYILDKWSSNIKKSLGERVRVLIYVHNLSYEFQWIRKRLKWSKLFFNEDRQPLKAITEDTIFEFRCSLILSGYKLETVGENLQKYKVQKLVGNLNYDKIRTPLTPMTTEELAYLKNDGDVVVSYIQEELEKHYNRIYNIELTKTGKVRKYMRKLCLYGGASSHKSNIAIKQYNKYLRLIGSITIGSALEYKMLKESFAGGFTHASNFASGKEFIDVVSLDETSAYPYQLVSKQYPMGNAEYVDIKSVKELEENNKYYCTLFIIEFIGLKDKLEKCYEHYISLSKCKNVKGVVVDNGRVVRASQLTMTITNVDYEIIKEYYSWDKIRIGTFIRYKKALLPREFVKGVLDLYQKKTTLKGVKFKEEEYMSSKEMLNACYGMCVTDICRDEIVYENDDYDKEPVDIEDALTKYNKNKQRFLAYQWGVWCSAYNRRDLYKGISECKGDYLYSDTDSLKIINYEKHKAFFEDYNKKVREKLLIVAKMQNLDFSLFEPTTIKGVKKLIGVFDYEETYARFKTLGAKRYMVEHNDIDTMKAYINGKEIKYETKYNITVSGVSKNWAVPYLNDLAKKKKVTPFKLFKDSLEIPKEYTGKMTHTYIDEEIKGKVKDYLGVEYSYKECSSIHLEKTSYVMSLASEYIDYLFRIRERGYY